MIITLSGSIPSKKNLLRRSCNGGMYRDRNVANQIIRLTNQARLQWAGRDPMVRPKLKAVFYTATMRADLDNMLTTVLDCLVKAGVLANDNIKNGPRPVTYDWLQNQNEGCVIELEEQ